MARKSMGSGIALLLAACIALVGCQNDTTRIGVVLPLTGDWKLYGEPIQKGIQVAYEKIQADANYPQQLELHTVDTQSDPAKAREALEEVFRDGAIASIGGATSAEAKEIVSVADRFNRVLLSPSASSPELTGISENFYRVYPSDNLEANKMADFAARKLKISSVAVLAEQADYAKGIQTVIKEQFEHFGVEVREVIEYPPNTIDFSGLIDHVVALDPDAVYLAAYAEAVGGMIRELRKQNYDGSILTTSAFALPTQVAELGQDAVNVLLTQTVFDVDSEHAHIQAFVKAYEQKYGQVPDLYAAYGYDTMMVLAEALKGRKAISLEVPKGLRSISDYPGVMGSIRFDDNGDVTRYPRIYTINEDLALYNYDAHVEQQKEAILQRMRELQRQARTIGSEG